MMIEVFKTNVPDRDKAEWLIDRIQDSFDNYTASFDLEDYERILVVKCTTGNVQSSLVVDLLRSFDYSAEVLPD